MKLLFCPVTVLFLFSMLPDQGVKGQVINVPDTQPPVYLRHYNYPVVNVSLEYTYLSPTECPVTQQQMLQNTSVTVPRGASVLNAIEIGANFNPSAIFECNYISGFGYFLTKLNNIPSDSEDPLCQWSWTIEPQVYASGTNAFSLSEVFIPLIFFHTPKIHFTYQHVVLGQRPRSRPSSSWGPPSNTVLTPENMSVNYVLAESENCSFPPSLASIPATPYTVSIQAGGSALNVMERAADLHPNLEFNVSSTFGVFYAAQSIAGVQIVPGCQWCLTYQPPNSTEIIIPESNLQNFVIPLPETTLRMEYTGVCLSALQVAIARRNMTYFREKGIIGAQTSKQGDPAAKECCCDGQKSSYSTTFLILASVLFLSSLFLCTRYFS